MVSLNSTVSCGTTPMALRRLCSEYSRMSAPLILMQPESGSKKRNSSLRIVDLPLPELPTIPSFSPAPILNDNPLRITRRLEEEEEEEETSLGGEEDSSEESREDVCLEEADLIEGRSFFS